MYTILQYSGFSRPYTTVAGRLQHFYWKLELLSPPSSPYSSYPRLLPPTKIDRWLSLVTRRFQHSSPFQRKLKMTRRKGHLFPRQVSDIGAFIFVCVMIPVTYMYETGLVLQHLYYRDAYTTYILHMVIGVFLLFNLLGNFIGLWLTDTSTRFVVLPSVIKVSRKSLKDRYLGRTLQSAIIVLEVIRGLESDIVWKYKRPGHNCL